MTRYNVYQLYYVVKEYDRQVWSPTSSIVAKTERGAQRKFQKIFGGLRFTGQAPNARLELVPHRPD